MKKLFLLLAAICCMVINAEECVYVARLGNHEFYNNEDATPYTGVTWTASTKTLTFNNANVNIPLSTYGFLVNSNMYTITIVVKGKNTLNVENARAIKDNEAPLTIVGASNDAELTVISGNNTAICATKGLLLGGGTYPLKLNLQGLDYGIDHTTGQLTIVNNVTLNIAATTKAAFAGSGSVDLSPGLWVTQPLGAEFVNGTLELNGSTVTSAVTIRQVTEYDLWVRGTRVNDANQSDVLKNGNVSYNPTTKTLTLDNADISGGASNSAIKTNISGLKIEVLGTCYLSSYSSTLPAVQCTANTTLTSSGANAKVSIQNFDNAAIINDDSDFNIDGGSYGMTVNIYGKSGIQGKNSSADLSIKNATVGFSSTTYGAIYGQNSINLNDCAITSPTGAKIYNGAIVDKNNQVITSSVNIRKTEKYDLYVAGTQVTALNCSDILGDGGKVKYDNATKTLTLNDATISSSSYVPLSNMISGLQIICNGTNTLSYTGSYLCKAMNLTAGTTVTTTQSNSQLTLNSTAFGIYLGDNNYEINGNDYKLKVNIKGSFYGICGPPDVSGSKLTIQDVNMDIAATTSGAIINLSSLTLTNVAVNEPTGCTFSTTNHALVKSGSVVKTAVKIGKPIEKYGVLIKGDQVTSENCNDILDDGGTVKYDNATKTLTLSNATISYAGDVISAYDNINIECIGQNSVESTYKSGNALYEDAGSITILGTGSVSFKAQSAAINLQDNLTIKGGCTVTAQSANDAAVALGGDSLTIDGATLIAKGNGKYATIAGCNSLVMNNGVEIRSAHTYDATSHKFLNCQSEEATDDIKIGVPTKYGIKIAGIEVTDENKDAITGESITGSVSYDPETATLTLDNANIDYTQTVSVAILITGDVKYIHCIGENIVICKGMNSEGIYFKETDITIKGTGTLSVKGQWSGIVSLKGAHTLSIVGCEVTVEGELNYAIYFDVNGGTLKVDSGTLIAKGNGHITIGNCFNLVMNNGVAIRSNHTYDATSHKFLNSKSEEATDDIVIGVESTGIEQVADDRLQVADGFRKVLRNGQLLIIREGEVFNAMGVKL